MLELVTFLLALVGYAGLAATAVTPPTVDFPFGSGVRFALVIVAHVALVWMVRYQWRVAEAVRNGYVGFLAFHGALAMIVASLVVAGREARVLVWTAFAVVSVGAIGATSRYDVVAAYRVPVILIAVAGAAGLARAYRPSRQRTRAAREGDDSVKPVPPIDSEGARAAKVEK